MNHSKYVTGEVDNNGLPVLVALVFPMYIPHDSVKSVFLPDTIRSAGMFMNWNGRITVFGESKSLGVCAMANDDKLIDRAVNHPKN